MPERGTTIAEQMQNLIDDGYVEVDPHADLTMTGWWRVSVDIFTSYDTSWANDSGGDTGDAQLERDTKRA